MDSNKYFKIGIGSLAIVIAIYIVYLMVVSLAVSYFAYNKATEMVDDTHKKVYVLDSSSPVLADNKEDVVYIDIKLGKNTVTVHTGMSKDSVLMIVGQPSSSNFGDRTHETCDYELPNYHRVHMIFSEGKLKQVIQH